MKHEAKGLAKRFCKQAIKSKCKSDVKKKKGKHLLRQHKVSNVLVRLGKINYD